MTSRTHPAGFTATNTINGAQQVSQISSSLSDSTHPPTLAVPAYTPWGAIHTLVNGCAGSGCTQVQETYHYNNRLQPDMMELGTASSPTAIYCGAYNYYSDLSNPTSCTPPSPGTHDNGNVVGYYFIDGFYARDNHAASYTYDALNRLTNSTAAPVAGGGIGHNLNYNYDRYGNATCTGGYGLCTQMSFDPTSNRITAVGGSPVTYDGAGNLTQDPSTSPASTYQWDAEGRLVSIGGNTSSQCASGATACFIYNALGQWVERYASGNPWGGHYLEIIYDASGQQFGRYTRDYSTWFESYVWLGERLVGKYAYGTIYFLHPNQVGSTTASTTYNGSVFDLIFYYPWGQPWTGWGSADPDQRFGSLDQLEPDGNVYPTPFRRYHSNLYRWLSPDPVAGEITNPQSLNLYGYVLNNPTTRIDPPGLDGGSEATCLLDQMEIPCGLFGGPGGSSESTVTVQCPNNDCTGIRASQGPGGSTIIEQWVPGSFSQNGGVIAISTGY